MKWGHVLVFIVLMNRVEAQSVDSRKWNTVEILCGTLIRSEEIPVKGSTNSFTDKSKPVKGAMIRLYRRNEDVTHFDGDQPIAEATSGRAGHFDFQKVSPGAYWMVVKLHGKDYELAITYAPDHKSDAKCSDILYALKKDQLEIQRVIVVD